MLRVPDAAKANVRLRTQNGSVLTDFDESVLITKTESTRKRFMRMASGRTTSLSGKKQPHTTGGAGGDSRGRPRRLPKPPMTLPAAVHAGSQRCPERRPPRPGSSPRSGQARPPRSTAGPRRRRPMPQPDARSYGDAHPRRASGCPVAPMAPTPPMPPAIPTITGGEPVTGTLNGGGPEISVSYHERRCDSQSASRRKK